MAKRRKSHQALVILGHDDPDRYDGVVCVRVVGCDRDGRIGPLHECTEYGARIHAWAVIKRKSLVSRFLRATKSAKGAHIDGGWFRVQYTDMLTAMPVHER